MKKLFTLFVLILLSLMPIKADFNGYWWAFGEYHINFDIEDNHPWMLTRTGYRPYLSNNSACAIYSEIFNINTNTNSGNNDSGHVFFTNGRDFYAGKWDDQQYNFATANVLLNGDPDGTMCAIARKPGSDSLFYIFTLDRPGGPKGLQYSVIDMQDIRNLPVYVTSDTIYLKEANVELLTKIPLTSKVYCTPHENNEDIWVITCELNSDRFYSFLLTANGIQLPPVISHTGHYYAGGFKTADGYYLSGGGYMRVTPDQRHLVYVADSSKVLACEFDNATGKVGMVKDSLFLYFGSHGLEFSPNGQHLFINVIYPGRIIQVNLTEKIFGDTVTIYRPKGGLAATSLQLGPDGAIYFIRANNMIDGNHYLSAIKNPNGWGTEVNIDLKAVKISGESTGIGLPLFDHFYRYHRAEAKSICAGDTLIVKAVATQGAKFDWTGPNGFKSELKRNVFPNATPELNGMYYLTVSFGDSIYADSAEVIVNVNPSVNISCSKTYICVEESMNISADEGFAEYYWNTGDTTQTITINTSGTYTVIAKDSNGCEASNSIFIKELEPPQPLISLAGARLCDGDKAKLLIKEAYSSYLWSTGETTQSIEITNSGTYSIIVVNDYNCVGYDTIEVNFKENPQPKVLGNLSFCKNETTTLSADANYQDIKWNTEESTNEITITQAGKYWYWAKDENGCEGWSDTVEVIEYPEVKVEIEGNAEICEGETTTLKTNKEYSAYKWSTGEETRAITVNQEGIYKVEVTDENGCKGMASIDVKTIEIVISDTEEIDFGECRLKKECIVTKAIKNNSNKAIHVNTITQSGDNAFTFTTTPSIPATIQPNVELQLEVKFTPLEKHVYSAKLTYEIDQPCTETVETVVRGTGAGISDKAIVWLPDISANVGDVDYCIPLFARLETDESVSDVSYTAIISFNANALYTREPNAGTVTNNERTITLTGIIPTLDNQSKVIGTFCGDILLADKALIPLKIDRIEFSENIETETQDGSLKLLFCQINIAAIKTFQSTHLTIKPNPASDAIDINITSEETGQFTLEIFSITGTLLERRSWSSSGKQSMQLQLDLSQYATGVYQVVMTSPSSRKTTQLRIIN